MFTKDSRAEQFLTSLGVDWEYTNDLSFAKLADGWETRNLGRSTNQIEAAVEAYRRQMDAGSAAPAPIVWRPRQVEKYEVLDGMQRIFAAMARKATLFSAYVVVTDSLAMVKKIRVFANIRLEGAFQEPEEWTIKHAIDLLAIQGSMSVEEIAEMGGWTVGRVRDKKECMEFGKLIERVGGPKDLPDTLVRSIGTRAKLTDFDIAAKPLGEFFCDLKTAKLTTKEAEPFVDHFFEVTRNNKANLYEQFAIKLQEFRDDDEIDTRLSGRRPTRLPPDKKLLKAIKSALTTAESIAKSGERVVYMAECYQIINKLKSVLKQIENRSARRRKAQ